MTIGYILAIKQFALSGQNLQRAALQAAKLDTNLSIAIRSDEPRLIGEGFIDPSCGKFG